MLVTGWVASRIGPRRTLLVGLALVVVFSALAGAAGSVFEIAGFRLGWGLGQRAVHRDRAVGDRRRGDRRADERDHPLRGRARARHRVRPAARRPAGRRLVARAVLRHRGADGDRLRPDRRRCSGRSRSPPSKVSIIDPLRALGHGGLRSMAIVAVLYNFGFFTILAYTPLLLGMSRAPARVHLLRLGPAGRADVGVRRAAAGAAVRARGRARRDARAGRRRPVRRRRLHASQAGLIAVIVRLRRAAGDRQHGAHRGGDGRRRGRAPDRLRRPTASCASPAARSRRSSPASSREHVSAGVADVRRRRRWSRSRSSRSRSRATTCGERGVRRRARRARSWSRSTARLEPGADRHRRARRPRAPRLRARRPRPPAGNARRRAPTRSSTPRSAASAAPRARSCTSRPTVPRAVLGSPSGPAHRR